MAIHLFGRNRIVDYNGKPMTLQGVREIERANLARKTELTKIAAEKQRRIDEAEVAQAEAEAEKARIALAEVQRVHDEKQAVVNSAESKKAAAEREKRRTKLYRRRNVTAVVVLCALIEYGGQVLFFTDYLPDKFRYLLYVAPLIVPTFTWGWGLDAYFRAKDKAPHAKSMMVMWISAIAATVMIAVDLTLEFKNPGWAFFAGGASIFGPLMFHLHVGSAADDAHEISALDRAKQIARKWANRMRHPFVWWGATDLHHASMGVIGFEQAFLMVYREKHGHLPGVLPVEPTVVLVPDFEVRRLRWLRKLLDRLVFDVSHGTSNKIGVSNGPSNAVASNGASNATSNEASGRHAVEAPSTDLAVAPTVAPTVAPPESESEVTAPMSTLLNEVDAYLESKGTGVAPIDMEAGLREISALLESRNSRSQAVAEQATSNGPSNAVASNAGKESVASNGPSNAVASNGTSNATRSNRASNTTGSNVRRLWRKSAPSNVSTGEVPASVLIRKWMDEQIASGMPVTEIFGSDAMEAVNLILAEGGRDPISRQGADNAVRNYRKSLLERREA